MTKFKWDVQAQPACTRDTTNLDSDGFFSTIWTRFYNGKPKKIGGYRLFSEGLYNPQSGAPANPQITRDMYIATLPGGYSTLFCGSANQLIAITFDPNGNVSNIQDRTPTDFVANPNNSWSFAEVSYNDVCPSDSAAGLSTYILACATPNLGDITSSVQSIVYYGIADLRTETDPDLLKLTPILIDKTNASNYLTTAGGITVIGNVIMCYDVKGQIFWNDGYHVSYGFNSNDNSSYYIPTNPNAPGFTTSEPIVCPLEEPISSYSVEIEIWPQTNVDIIGVSNFVYGAPVRNGDTLGGLFWGVNGCIKGTYVGRDVSDTNTNQPLFTFSIISYNTSLLSSSSVVYYDPYFYWIGKNSFWMYNGTVQEIPNTDNKVWFFNNINPVTKNYTFGFPNTQYGEIWWGFANINGTSNQDINWALIYGKDTQRWFDTSNFYRACGINDSTVFPYPILAGNQKIQPSAGVFSYPLWQHEFGVNQVIYDVSTAITASFQYSYVSNPEEITLVADDLLLDLNQVGQMSVQLTLEGYPRTTPVLSPNTYNFTPTTQHLTMREKGNLISLIFTSNDIDGDFLMGRTKLIVTGDPDERPGPVDPDPLQEQNVQQVINDIANSRLRGIS